MLVHLQYNHQQEYNEIKAIDSGVTGHKQASQQPTIIEAFEQLTPIPKDSLRWQTLTHSVCYCIAKDMLSLSGVNDPGFKHMLKTFEPRYIPPDRSALTRRYMPKLYEQEKTKIEQAIGKEMTYFAVTCDGWSSRANHSYIAMILHYIDSNWQMCAHLLETAESTADHTAENLAAGLEDMLTRWKLPISCLSSTTIDNARNITLALASMEWPHVECFAHTIQLSVKKAMEVPEVARTLGRARRLVGHFHHSVKSSNILRQKQKDLHHPELSLSQDVATRWNSAYYMLESILKQQQPVFATLLEVHKADLIPTNAEITCMEIFLDVLKPFVEITESVGGEKWVTLSLVRPLLYKLI